MDSKENPNKLGCVLIGGDSLLLECAERLLAADFRIDAILTDAPRVREWAQMRGFAVLPAQDLVETDLHGLHCDYLFSITWLRSLPDFLREWPQVAAINIQDSPLPRYSGPHGPAWALMAQERHYGITWHLAGEQVGEGGILQAVPIALDDDDTSLSLNMKCFEAALAGFESLLPDLAEKRLVSLPQEETQRKRFQADQRPAHWGCLDWSENADTLAALVRALDYGSYQNPFCMAKMLVEGTAVGVTAAIAEPSKDDVEPGTVLALSERGLVVAAAQGQLRVVGLCSLRGQALDLQAWTEEVGLQVGQVLKAPHAGYLSGLTALLPGIAEAEATWIQRLRACDPLSLSYDRAPDLAPAPQLQRCEVEVPAAFLAQVDAEERRSALRTACLVHLSRLARQESFRVRYVDADLCERIEGFSNLLSASIPLGVEFDPSVGFAQTTESVNLQLEACRQLPPFLKDLQGRSPDSETQRGSSMAGIAVVAGEEDPQPAATFLCYRFNAHDEMWLEYAPNRIEPNDAQALATQLGTLLASIAEDSSKPIGSLQFLPEPVIQKLLTDWNDTTLLLPDGRLVHSMIEAQCALRGDSVAVVAAGQELSYTELDRRASEVAAYLASLGIGPGEMVGICMQRTADMMIGLLGILKAGAAYLPLDPDFPPARLHYMVKDSGVQVVFSDRWSRALVADCVPNMVALDEGLPAFEAKVPQQASPSDLAYVIYTSGSTGDPKGVMLEHEQVTNFFLGMDERLGTDPGVWLAVTSLSFDISVLELLWTLTCGYKVVLFEGFDRGLSGPRAAAPHDVGQMDFSLMLWGATGGGPGGENPYRLMLDAARFGDTHGFRSIWIPERHFHEFGGPYPNPAVAGAAIAAVTERIGIRTGSVVLPFHDPVLMAEDWSMVDNLSGGRVGLAIASGWHPNDFVLEPESFTDRKEIMRTRMGQLRSLWRGEALALRNPLGEEPEIITRPRPVQQELPIWLTAAGNPDTFRLAGEMGVHVLTHLLGQNVEEVAGKIRLYREAWQEAGHPGSGHVTMMLHTMLGKDREEIRALARGPMCSYLATAADLLKDHMSAWAAVRTPMNKGTYDTDFHLDDLDPQDVQDLLEFAYERYFETDALFGTPDTCEFMLDKLRTLEVDEVACLIDFGADPEVILQQLPYLDTLRKKVQEMADSGPAPASMEALIAEHQVTHLQCTPSMATMLLAEPAIAQGLATLEVMMVGGEALTEDLAAKLRALVPGRVMNMYGLTETAIWSSTADIEQGQEVVSLGQPLANNRFYVLDQAMQLVPPGLSGELYISGLCVARGYLGRDDLTESAFLPDPFDDAGGRIYRSGDQVRQLPDGTVRFLGRGDQQVKVNGYRIELGEIESAMLAHEEVSQAVVLVLTNRMGVRVLVAHFVLEAESGLEIETLRAHLRTCLPEYMVPREFHPHERFPKTNNGKTDRKSLARGPVTTTPPVAAVAPVAVTADGAGALSAAELEEALDRIWCDILGLESLNREANFFDLGGHSLLTISLKRILKAQHSIDVPLVALFRYSTVRSLAEFLAVESQGKASAGGSGSTQLQSAAAKRAALRKARRGRG